MNDPTPGVCVTGLGAAESRGLSWRTRLRGLAEPGRVPEGLRASRPALRPRGFTPSWLDGHLVGSLKSPGNVLLPGRARPPVIRALRHRTDEETAVKSRMTLRVSSPAGVWSHLIPELSWPTGVGRAGRRASCEKHQVRAVRGVAVTGAPVPPRRAGTSQLSLCEPVTGVQGLPHRRRQRNFIPTIV